MKYGTAVTHILRCGRFNRNRKSGTLGNEKVTNYNEYIYFSIVTLFKLCEEDGHFTLVCSDCPYFHRGTLLRVEEAPLF